MSRQNSLSDLFINVTKVLEMVPDTHYVKLTHTHTHYNHKHMYTCIYGMKEKKPKKKKLKHNNTPSLITLQKGILFKELVYFCGSG